jgi:hypothetical protein
MPVFSQHPACGAGKGKTWRRRMTALKAGGGLCLLLLSPQVATAETLRPSPGGPDEADLRLYLECSRIAGVQLLGFDDAVFCSRVFMRIKLSFVPGMTLESFDKLTPQEKTAVNTVGYLRYRDWVKANAAWLETLTDATGS